MLEERSYNKPKQKLIYSKDSSLNFGMQASQKEENLLGLFKSSSSLARNLRSSTTSASSEDQHNTLKSTAALILNQSGMSIPKQSMNLNKNIVIKEEENTKNQNSKWAQMALKSEVPKNQMDIKIRNIVHNYTDIDVNEYTYNILSNLKSKKRVLNLDSIDDYEVWKEKKVNTTENEVKNKIEELKDHLENTKNELYSKFSMTNEELILMVQSDIDEVVNSYNTTLEIRDNKINECVQNTVDIFDNCHKDVNLRINKLSIDLDKIGYLLEEEIKSVIDDKKAYIQRFKDVKTNYYSRLTNEIKETEKLIAETSNKDLREYILRWKNVKLNNYITKLKNLLNSKEYVDCVERADLIKELKKQQEDLYQKRFNLIFNQLFNLDYEQIN